MASQGDALSSVSTVPNIHPHYFSRTVSALPISQNKLRGKRVKTRARGEEVYCINRNCPNHFLPLLSPHLLHAHVLNMGDNSWKLFSTDYSVQSKTKQILVISEHLKIGNLTLPSVTTLNPLYNILASSLPCA